MSSVSVSELALYGGTPVRSAEKRWPSWPVFGDEERRAVSEVLESGKWWFGERVREFERTYAAFQDARHCITSSSGTAALEAALQALGVRPGDEVLVPAYTFIATASAVARVGAAPVFVDVDETWNIDPDRIEPAFTDRTKGIIPVHFGGRVCDMDRIRAIAERHGLFVLEDACHSWGAKWQGKGTGALGDCGVFSFQMSKNITSGEGGAILTDNDALAELFHSTVNCGRGGDGTWYGHVRLGTNARLTEFQAAILSAQLTRLEAQTLLREKNAAVLDRALGEIDGLIPQPGDIRITRRAYHLYCLRVDPERFGCSREQLVKAARAEGLPLSSGYTLPLYKQPAFAAGPWGRRYADCRCPVTEDLCSRNGMWLTHPILLGSEEDMQDIVSIFGKIKSHAGQLTGA